MVATPLATLNPYIPLDVRKVYWVASIASIAAPSRGEIDAGTDLSPQVTDIVGWTVTSGTIPSQSLVGAALKLPGAKELVDSTITCRNSRTATDARTILTIASPPTTGYIVVLPEGDTTGYKMNVFSVAIIGAPLSPGIVDPATTEFQFAMLDYRLRVTVP
jgi:hypothetical protein